MAEILQEAPGIHSAAAVLNQIPKDVLSEMCSHVVGILQYKVGRINIRSMHEKTVAGGYECSEDSIQNAINGLNYIYRSACKHKLNPETLGKQLSSSLMWSAGTVKTIQTIWEQQGNALNSSHSVNQVLSVGKIVDFQWKLGMATSSNSCKNLNSPFITVMLTISKSDGKSEVKSFEMTIPEFQNFSKQMKELAGILETV